MENLEWRWKGSANEIWKDVAGMIREGTSTVLETACLGGALVDREHWWCNEEVQFAIMQKKATFRSWQRNKSEEACAVYQDVQKVEVYTRKVAQARERKSRYI